MFRPVSLFLCSLTVLLLVGCATTAPPAPTTFYPPLPLEPRLQFLTALSSEADLGKKAGAFREFVVGDTGPKRGISRAMDVGSVKGMLYVTDLAFGKIVMIDLKTGSFDLLKDQGPGALRQPLGLHVNEDGYKYVADGPLKQVVVFGPDDAYLRSYGKEGQFERPMDVAVFGERIYVADFPRHVVVVMDKTTGEIVQTLGGRGTAAGKMDRPSHVRVDRQGNLFVNDSFNFRIQKFDPQGEFLKEFGYSGATLGGFARPKGMDVSPDGKHLYVTDAAFENVQIFDDETTQLLLYFSQFGTGPGDLYLPQAVFIDDKNVEYFQQYADKNFKIRYLVIVSNSLGFKKLNIYGFGDWIGERLPEMDPPQPTGANTAPQTKDAAK
jgi:DNA-binding beta-propeller fold protein YncE